jgi:pimeloyl-ACP methyl ester carboxylesterase
MITPSSTTVRSADGTSLAYTRRGSGPAVILIDGALCHRGMGPNFELGGLLAELGFTTYVYDRRGRGESAMTAPYAVAREVEDVAALLEAAGGSASLFGISSGAALALEAAAVLDGVSQVVCFEPPFVVDDAKPALAADFVDRLDEHVAAGDVLRLRGERLQLRRGGLVVVPAAAGREEGRARERARPCQECAPVPAAPRPIAVCHVSPP